MNRFSWWHHAAITVAAVVVLGIVATLSPFSASADQPLAGSAGTDTALADTPSAVTVTGRGPFADLKIDINQTANLTNQAVSVRWSGARPSASVAENFLQIFQCWGADDGTNADNPGPPPEQCQFGGQPFAGNLSRKVPPDVAIANEFTRAISQTGWPGFDPSLGVNDPDTGKLWLPFRAVDGKQIDAQLKVIPSTTNGVGVAWQNPYFDFNTTNEVPFGRTYLDGSGSELFQLATGLEARGLGCGQAVQIHEDGSPSIPKCWLVIVPRGTAAEENPPGVNPTQVVTSPLAPAAWRNRIAVPLDFNPVDSSCAIGANERRIVGSELSTSAVTSWQPALCGRPGSSPFAYGSLSDAQARQQLTSKGPGAPGMAIVSQPIDRTAVDPADPVTYAPVALSGLVVGFNIERVPTDKDGNVIDPAEAPLRGVRVAHINLTPRLVAKLLTQSYLAQFVDLHIASPPTGYGWVAGNPTHLTVDPDFVQFNPEFSVVFSGYLRNASGLVLEASTSDAAHELWRWVLADPEAAAWLAGQPDSWGMKINPFFSTDPALNPSGAAFGQPIPDSFPRNDPYCSQSDAQVGNPAQPVRALCMLDFQPLALSLQSAAQVTRAANDGAKLELDSFAGSAATAWVAEGPQRQGTRAILSVTDAASASRYGLQVASLSRAGDDGGDRRFVVPDQAGLLAGQQAMVPSDVPGVLKPDPTTTVAGAYPLTMLTYAAVKPRKIDEAARNDYATFVAYAAGDGQVPGLSFGQLPPGYAPLPDALRAQAAAAAITIRTGDPVPEAAPTTTSTTSTTGPPMPTQPAVATPAQPRSTGLPSSSQSSLGTSPSARTISPAVATPSPTVPPPAVAMPAASTARTPLDQTGAVRYTLPLIVLIGMLASIGALALAEPKRRRNVARTRGERSDPRSANRHPTS